MNKIRPFVVLLFLSMQCTLISCDGQVNNPAKKKPSTTARTGDSYKEGSDYILFKRVRIVDNTGIENGGEAYSLLLPKGWQQQSNVVWNMPGTSCAGTFKWLKASSPDSKFKFEMYPDIMFGWNSDPQMNQFNQNNPGSSPYCSTAQPMDAEQYLRNVFAPSELQNAKVVKVEANPLVVQEMQQGNEKTRTELMQYGATQLQFYQTAINATVQFSDNTEGLVVLGVTVLENVVPNVYNGSYSKIYTTQVAKRTLFRYPASEREQAAKQFAVIMGSLRTNVAWSETVNKYWKDVRQNKHIAHIGKIRMMDEQTKAIGDRAIQKGQSRLDAMDTEMRSWEQRQGAQDRMHTNFIKTIRGVENYQDANGKVELTSAYDHAWSRGDGTSFIMSNNPNFDPAAVLLDQNWKQMKKVD